MPRPPFIAAIVALVAFLSFPSPTCADTVATSAGSFDGVINGLRNGRLSLTQKSGTQRLLDLADVSAIALDQSPQFLAAEKLRADPLQSIAAAAA